jgi:Fe-S oxidoreductase
VGTARLDPTDWTKGLPFEVPTVASLAASPGGLDTLEVLYWVGCAAAFDERNKRVARAVATCLDAAGIRFAILGQEESCTGDPARRMGNDYVFQILAAGNVETLNRYGMGERTSSPPARIASTRSATSTRSSAGSSHRPPLGVPAEAPGEGRLRIVEDGAASASVTYHDSCYLARYNGVVAAPRDVLGAVPGLELREMDRSGKNTFCCGAGGGRMWMEETRGTRINAERTRQALETGASTVATACPYCMTMLKDGLSDAQSGAGVVSARDIAEILADVVVPTRSDPRRALPVLQ